MPEQQKNELVLWEEPVERVYAEEIPNEPEYRNARKENNSNLGLYVLVGAICLAGIVQIVQNSNKLKRRSEDRKKNATEGL